MPKAGEIWLGEARGATGSQYTKIRPWIIISNDKNNYHSGMINAIPITTKRAGRNIPMHVSIRAGEVEGISQDSIASVESSMPVEKVNFVKKVGNINDDIEYEICNCFAIQIPMLQKWLEKKIKEREVVRSHERERISV